MSETTSYKCDRCSKEFHSTISPIRAHMGQQPSGWTGIADRRTNRRFEDQFLICDECTTALWHFLTNRTSPLEHCISLQDAVRDAASALHEQVKKLSVVKSSNRRTNKIAAAK